MTKPMTKFILKLYITGHTPTSERALENLKRIAEQEMKGEYEIAVIDILENPQLAEDERIIATPTLIKVLPAPLRRVMGDFSEKEKVLLGLGMVPKAESS